MSTSENSNTIGMVTVDCSDPVAQAEFWSELLGGEVAVATEEYSMVVWPGTGHPALGFGHVADYVPPQWPNPNGSKQFHLDIAATDIASAEKRALDLGARLADPQPGETWRVLIDPAGHPFCICDAANFG
ncbi:MAG: VOC family protein [Corynebacterium variabile]|nr:VOC family protein [Corynebacterium variabile]